MKITRSQAIAAIALALIALWFISQTLLAQNASDSTPSSQPDAAAKALPAVVIQDSRGEEHPNRFELYGRTEANREVQVKAETPGLIASTPIVEGSKVKKGSIVCRQDVDARRANLDQAKASLAAAEFNYQSTQSLVDKGYKSAVQLKSQKANVDGAIASVKRAEIELDNVKMRAPFSGVLEKQIAEIGDYLAPGQPCALLVDLSPLVVVVELTESQVGSVSIGQEADIKLATGEKISGNVRLIETKANASTRTFRTEIAVPNDDYKFRAGVTATVSLAAGTTVAQYVPAKILSLNEDGTVGIRYLDFDDRVRFANVKTIDEDANGIWVTGLPENTRVITQGQDYVAIGSQVDPKYDYEITGSDLDQ